MSIIEAKEFHRQLKPKGVAKLPEQASSLIFTVAPIARDGSLKSAFQPLSNVIKDFAREVNDDSKNEANLRFKKAVEHTEWVLTHELSLYPTEHPVTKYTQSLLNKIIKVGEATDFRILVYKDKRPSAFVLPNGLIFVNDELLEFSDTENELLFVLRHEKNHVLQGHAKAMFERFDLDKPERLRALDILEYYGTARLHEWEADIDSFLDLDDLGINPLGGIDLLEKFRAGKRKIPGITHGSETDRVLNLRQSIYYRDLGSLEKPLLSIPELVKEAIRTERVENKYTSPSEAIKNGVRLRKLEELRRGCEKADAAVALLALPDLAADYKRVTKIQKSPTAQRWAEEERKAVAILSKKIWEHINNATASLELSRQQRTFLFFTVLDLVSGFESTNEVNQNMLFDRSLQVVDVARKAHHLAWSENNFGFQRNLHAPEDLEELLDMLRPADVNATKLNLVFEPQLFAKNIISRTFEKQMFHDGEDKFQINEYVRFAAILTDKLAAVYGSQGSVRLNTATLYKQIIEVGQAHLTTEVYDTLVKEAVNARPDAAYELSLVIRGKDQEVQQTPMNKFISVLEEIARVAEPYIKQQRLVQEKRKSSDFGSTKAFDKISQRMYRALKKKAPQLQEIFQQVANHDPSQLLRFFASFRNHLVLNPELKALQEFESIWIEVLAEAITILPLINSFTDPMEKILYLTKIAVALNSDTLNDDYYFEFAELVEKGAFTFEGLKKLYQFFSNPDQLYAEVEVPLRNEEYFFADSWDYTSREAIYLLLQKSLELPQEEFSHELERLTLEFPLNHYGVNISSALNENEETPPLVESRKSSVLKRALSQYEFDLTNPQHLRDLYFISTYLDDINFAMRLQAVIWQKLTAMISFSESMSFIEREIKDRRLLSLRSFSHLVEERAYSHEEIDEARQTMMQLLTHESTSINFGRMILAEQFLDRIFTRHKADLLLACLDNDGDRALKEYLYASWKESYQIDPLVVEAVNLEDILQRFYRLDGQSKYILLRNLLCGEGGVLVDKDKKERGKLIDYFLDNYVEATNKTERKYLEVTRNVMREFAINARFDSLYFALAPLLQERILVPPTKRISWKYVIKEQGAPPDFYRVTSNGKEISDHKKVLRTITGRRQDKQRLSYEQERGEYEARIEALLGQLEGLPMQTKINVMELPLEFAKSLGAPAVRILQASLQYLELPKDAEDKAQAVYDNVPGQSKISGHYTLTSQWPQARAELTGIGKKIGGGSLNTVWQTDNLAVKVLNPNAQFHTDTTCELLAQIFTILAREDRRFEPLLTAVDDIQQWIKEDINFQGFLEADKRFKEKHDGFTLGGRYVVKIPKTYEPENSKFMLEDYIEGFNLTQSTELKLQGHDLREIITLLTRNFFAQIKDGQVLSNIHPGNVRVRGNEVVILDRNYYLDLNMNDKLFLAGLVQNLNNIPFVTELCLSYLIQQGVEIDSRQRARIKKRINTLSQITDPSDRLLGLSVTLRKEKLRFPLKITLLVQDFFYLDRMAKKVDYSGILDAYEGQVND